MHRSTLVNRLFAPLLLMCAVALIMPSLLKANENPGNTEAYEPSPDSDTFEDCQIGEPVDILSGNRWMRARDISLPTPGIALELSRQYNSRETDYDGPLGKGWFHSLDWRLSESLEMVAVVLVSFNPIHPNWGETVEGPDGQTVIYPPQQVTVSIELYDGEKIDHGIWVYPPDIGHITNQVKLVTAYVRGAGTRPPPDAYFDFGNHAYYHDFGIPFEDVEPIGHRPETVITNISASHGGVVWGTLQRTHHWLEVQGGDGRLTRLHPHGDGYKSQDSPWRIYREGDNFVLVTTDGTERVFSPHGLMLEIRDHWGNNIALTYTGDQLSRAEHSNGTAIDFTHAGGRITKAEVASDFHVTYNYDTNSQLQSVVRYVGGISTTSSYAYTEGFLTRSENALGQVSNFAYEQVNGKSTHRATRMDVDGHWYPDQITYHGDLTRRAVFPARGQEPVFEHGFSPKKKLLEKKLGPGTNVTDARKRGVSFQYKGSQSATSTPWLYERRYFDNEVDENIGGFSPGQTDSKSFSVFTERGTHRMPTHIAVSYKAFTHTIDEGWIPKVPVLDLEWDAQALVPTKITDPAGGRIEITYTNRNPKRISAFHSVTEAYETSFTYTTNGLLTAVEDANGHVAHISYDASGYPARITPPAGPSIELQNTPSGFVVSVESLSEGQTNSTGRIYQFARNAAGRINAMTFPDGSMATNTYNEIDAPARITDRAGRHTDMLYILFRNLASVTRYLDPDGENIPVTIGVEHDEWLNALKISEPRGRYVETYELDLQDRPVKITNIEGQMQSIYYGLGQMIQRIDRYDGTHMEYWYDNAGRPAASMWYDGNPYFSLVSYSANGLPVSIRDGVGLYPARGPFSPFLTQEFGNLTFTYDLLGRMTGSVQSAPGRPNSTYTYKYDPVGNPTNSMISLAGGNTIERQYQSDAAGRLVSLTQSGTGVPPVVFGYTYAPENGLVSRVENVDTGIAAAYAYDIMDRITDIQWSGAGEHGFAMAYSNADMITNIVHAGGEKRVYTYDSIDRLTGEQHYDASQALTHTAIYEYDLAGNRTQTVINGVTNTYTLGLGNQLDTWTGGSYSHDTAGNVTQITDASGTRALSWDIQYRLTGVAAGGTPVETYGYDPLGRRACTYDGSVTNWHVYDGMHCIADLDETGTILRSYTYGPGIDNLLAITVHDTTTNTYYAITDHLGTVHALADSTGNIVESYKYDAWGRVLEVRDAAGQLIPVSAIGNRYMFQGREYSWATGLYNFRARWYDPTTGRWLSKDPIGISGGLNQYVAFGNNPVMFIDPLGLYQYKTSNLFLAFLHEMNPFNMHGSVNAQFAASWALGMGDTQSAMQWSGQGQLDDECAGKGWKAAYWGGIGTSAIGVSGAFVANLFNAGAASTFYSGSYPLAYEAALAGKGSGILITQTLGGQVMQWLNVNSTTAWSIASAIFAANAKGTAQVFLRSPSATSVWSTVEQPILLFLKNAELVFK